MRSGPAPRRPGELAPWERRLHLTAAALVGGSGLLLWWMKYGIVAPDDPFSVVNHPWQPQTLHLHVLAAPIWILAIGLMLRDHVIARLRNPLRRRGRATGSWTLVLIGPMILSGYLLQVVTDDAWRRALVWAHIASGCLWIAVFAAHVVVGWMSARRLRRGLEAAEPALEHGGLHLRVGQEPVPVRGWAGRSSAGRGGR